MGGFDIWTIALTSSLNDLSIRVISFLPNLLAAVIVFLIGLLLSDGAASLVRALLQKSRVDEAFDHLGVKEVVRSAGFELNVAKLASLFVKWFVIVIFLIAVANTLGLTQISEFINEVALYLPNVIASAIILILGVVLANLLSNAVHKAALATDLVSAGVVSSVTKWAVLIFVFMAVLAQLKIAQAMIETLFTGVVAALALAVGLAFGLGGKDKAAQLLDHLSKQLTKKK